MANLRSPARRAALTLCVLALGGCAERPPEALGTLEYDRIALPAPAAERIAAVAVKEGDRVRAGATLLVLDSAQSDAQTRALAADAQRQREALAELQAGTRGERVAQAAAQLASAEAQARDARAYYARLQPLGARALVAAADVDRARAAAATAEANVRAARAARDELVNGARREQVAQARSAVSAAEAQLAAQTVSLRKLRILAPRDGRIDSLPYKLGDQAPVGAPLAVMLVGDAPYARVYVPEPMRANVTIGDRATVRVDGRAAMSGRVRAIRSEPSFTPYYALSGKDAARLSYLAEIELDAARPGAGAPGGTSAPNAAPAAATASRDGPNALPAGLPVRVEFVAGPAP